MKKLKDAVNVIIKNYVNFDGWNLTKEEVMNFLNDLTYDDIILDKFNYFEFKDCNETIRIFPYIDSYDTIVINIEGIF